MGRTGSAAADVPAGDSWTAITSGKLGEVLVACLEAAVTAPSIHNSQPWRFRVRRAGIDVYADRERQVSFLDPDGRELMISLGAAVLNLRLTMLVRGRLPVLRLRPESADPDLVARVSAGQPVEPRPTVRALADAMPRRHTNRFPFANRPVPEKVLAELSAAATAEGATLSLVGPVGRDAILALIEAAERAQRADWRYRDELRRWTAPRVGRLDGVPPYALGPQDDTRRALPLRDFSPTRTRAFERQASFEPHPTILTLSTVGDREEDWLRAGQALQRVLLTATVRGLAATPMTQPTEVPDVRRLLADARQKRAVQAVLRIGYGPQTVPTPRRPISDVLD